MTFHGAFPSSPLSRSALRGDTGLGLRMKEQQPRHASNPSRASPLLDGTSGEEEIIDNGPRNAGSLLTMQARRASQPASASSASASAAAAARSHPLTMSTPPHRFRQPGAWSPDSAVDAYVATSPPSHLHHPRSPPSSATRSPTSSSRRRFSGQSFGVSPTPNFGSLIGSYEESLLSGRMSTLPSKPLIFDAELGVLGLGKCKPSLRCPPHLNVKFPAHFYSLEGASEKEGKVSPGSPYVGTIDIESHYLDELLACQFDEALALSEDASSQSTTSQQPMDIVQGGAAAGSTRQSHPMRPSPRSRRGADDSQANDKDETEAQSTKLPAFPGYRVPPKGQIQLVIKNPNHTAVKLFLVPYDLSDMPAGTKTFIRQKSHAAPPVPGSETGLASRPPDAPPPSPSPSPSSSITPRLSAKETLRYAVHLQFCAVANAPAKAARKPEAGFEGLDVPIEARTTRRARASHPPDPRAAGGTGPTSAAQQPKIYLHKNIRVCFAARLPDKSEKLSVLTDTPGGVNGNKEQMYASYAGPGEEWREAKRAVKLRERAKEMEKRRPRDSQMIPTTAVEDRTTLANPDDDSLTSAADVSLTETGVSGDLSAAEDVFIFNSDPNGERWEESRDEVPVSDNVDIPQTQSGFRPASWVLQHEEEQAPASLDTATAAAVAGIDEARVAFGRSSRLQQQSTSRRGSASQTGLFQGSSTATASASVENGAAPFNYASLAEARSSSPHLQRRMSRYSEEQRSTEDDRALLESWHQTLALRPQSSSSSSHSHSSSSLQQFQARPPSPTSTTATMNRPTSSSSSTSSSAGGASTLSMRPLSPSRPSSKRPTSPPSTTSLGSVPGGRMTPTSPHRPRHYTSSLLAAQAGAAGGARREDEEGQEGVSSMKPSAGIASAVLAARPTLMRRLSSQTAINAVPTTTPAVAEGASSGVGAGQIALGEGVEALAARSRTSSSSGGSSSSGAGRKAGG
ncbi:hypothetical protein FA10DRAFT_106380 [Acaromyces ingoldii]|uniref:Atos-like conserved domain-containing protein n=1 Tax=Acaromyces ingoldii TaxID=215250 RepID=A0A316YM55_9BASI|nr:hypothetical protein FA10DRAFT_106380 [Acaromyces ingoldii]PWN90146.1 hypothetical protein FA10DRAFT_106380 [Acaromyces ingoldii]